MVETIIGKLVIEILIGFLILVLLVLHYLNIYDSSNKLFNLSFVGLLSTGSLFLFRLVCGLLQVPIPPGLSLMNLYLGIGFLVILVALMKYRVYVIKSQRNNI